MSCLVICCCYYYFELCSVADWAQVFATLLIAWFVYRYSNKWHNELLKLEQPVIAFIITKESNPDYLVENVGKGPAINPTVYSSKNDNVWDEKVKCNSLAPNGKLKIHWTSGVKYLGASYQDVYGKEYYCFMEENKMHYYKAKEIKNATNPFNWSVKSEKPNWEI